MTPGLLENLSWRFGGPLGSVAPAIAWGFLAVGGAAGLAGVIASYRRTLVELRPGQRGVLLALRLALLALMLLLLAGPVRIEKARPRPVEGRPDRPLALLVDRSESMLMRDNRGQNRVNDAQRLWRTFAASAAESFSAVKTFAFSEQVVPVADEASAPNLPGGQTHLLASLQRVLADAPAGGWGGLVTLTDGLDTSGNPDATEAVIAGALKAGTPLYFVPGRNRYAGGSFLRLRDWTAPSQLSPRSTFRLEVTIDSYQPAARSVPVRLRVGGDWRATEMLRIESGHRMLLWSADIAADAPGNLPLELQIGEEAQAIRARTEIQVRSDQATRILYHQGALDWGYKFLADILRRDPAFVLTPIIRLAPVQATRNTRTSTIGQPLPAERAGYADYDVVVLANTSAAQLSGAQQNALTEWVRSGGVLIFLTPDDASTQGFAGSELEKMLPVVFAPADSASAVPANGRSRLRSLARGGGRFDLQDSALAEFSWEPAAARIFGRGEIASPRFVNYASVLRAKPGAEILARHPTAPSPANGDPGRAILLAVQRYGQGQSAVLTSDALWRWKLNQPSTERNVEKFWQYLFAWLGRERASQLRFDHAPLTVARGQEIFLRLSGNGAGAATVTARAGATVVTLSPGPPGDGSTQLFRWSPSMEGEWQLSATDAAGKEARHWLQVLAGAAAGERSGAPPDEALLARFADRTGGAVLQDGELPAWKDSRFDAEAPAPPEIAQPLWHHAWVFAALLGCYSIELILRRWWRLL